MSWSVEATGPAATVRKAIASQFASRSACSAPDETVRQAASVLIDEALAAQDPANQVSAKGSATKLFGPWIKDTGASNTLTIVIEPLGHGETK